MNDTGRLLAVNDDATQLRLMQRVLARHGYEVYAARSAVDGLRVLEANPGVLGVVTDLHMPGIDGWRFCRLLRSPEYRPFNDLPILVVSATYSGDDAEQLTAELGANGFLPAPYEASVLLMRVRDMLAGRARPASLRVLLMLPAGAVCDQLRIAFAAHGYDVECCATLDEGVAAFEHDMPGIVVVDDALLGGAIDSFMARIRGPGARNVVLVAASSPNSVRALEVLRAGADDYMRAPFDPEYVVAIGERARRARAMLRVEELLEERTRSLRESEARLRAMLRAMPDMVLVYAPDGTILHANHAAAECLEYAITYFPGRNLIEFIDPQSTATIRNHLAAERASDTYHYETCYRTASGRSLRVQVIERRLQFGGRPALLGMVRDLTGRLRIEEERAVLAAALEQAAEVFLITGVDGTIRYANHAFEDVTGYDRRTVVGEDIAILRVPDEPLWTEMTDALARFESWSGRMRRRRSDGTDYVREGTVTPVRDQSGAVTGFVGVERDVTREAELQHALAQAQKMDAVGTLAGGIAHDFNNLLTAILGYANLVRRLVGRDTEVAQMAEIIEQSARRASQLTQQLLGFARRGKNRNVPVDLNDTVRQTVRLLSRTIDKGILLDADLSDDALCVRGDPSQIEQALLNLALNARDALEGRPDASLEFRTGRFTMDAEYCARNPGATEGRYGLVEVRDNGWGIPSDIVPRIFEPFFTTKPSGKGTGMGLSMVYGIVKAHGGTVRVSSRQDHGTTVRVFLPLVEQKPEAPRRPKTEALVSGGGR
ncbi:MAG: PAS domain S-box protein, partial [Planctomycetota bacterium]|nr:PAS domain S-box protein [Planctomycetota bacterium]